MHMMRGLLQLYSSESYKRLPRALFYATRASCSSSSSLHSVLNVLSSLGNHSNTTTSIGSMHPWSLLQHRGVKVNAIHVVFKICCSFSPLLLNFTESLMESTVSSLYTYVTGRIYQVVDVEHRQRGRGGAMMQIEIRDVDNGSKQNSRFGTEESVERVFVQEKPFTCLYTEDNMAYLMDPVNFEQLEVPLELFGKSAAYLQEDLRVKLQLYDGRPLSGSVPKQVTCSIKETQANMKGTTVTPRYVKAVLDNGLTVQVPPYVKIGEKVIFNTEDDTFVSRA
ncbi:Elongation factor P [Linum perenne]